MSEIHGHVVFGKIVVHPAPALLVHGGVLIKSHADTPNHSAEELAARCFGVENPARAETAKHSRHSDLAQVGVDANFSKLRAKGVHGVAFFFSSRLGVRLGFDVRLPTSGDQRLEGFAFGRIGSRIQTSIFERDVLRADPGQRRL